MYHFVHIILSVPFCPRTQPRTPADTTTTVDYKKNLASKLEPIEEHWEICSL